MQEFPMNGWAILVCALVRMVFGMIWHSPILFGPAWMRLTGCTDAEMKGKLPKAVPIDFIGSIIMAFVLLHAVHYAQATSALLGAAVGFFNWLGLVAVSNLASVLYEKKPFKLFLIDMSGQLVALCVMGAILAIWP